MNPAILVATGGALGALGRWAIGSLSTGMAFPWATLGVNLIGSLLLGGLAAAFSSGSVLAFEGAAHTSGARIGASIAGSGAPNAAVMQGSSGAERSRSTASPSATRGGTNTWKVAVSEGSVSTTSK